MNLGRLQLGTTLELHLLTRNADHTPSVPDDCPQVLVKNAAGTILVNKEMPVRDRYTSTGLFHFPLFLGNEFATGYYEILYFWRVGGYYGFQQDTFEIVAGGHADGEITNAHFYQRPHAGFLVQSLETGRVAVGRNPTV